MIVNLFAQHLDLHPDTVRQMLALPANDLYHNPDFQHLVATLNRSTLENTAGVVRQIYEVGLPEIKERYSLSDTIMSGYTLANWVLGFIMYADRLWDMLSYHTRLSSEMIAEVLPELLVLLVAGGPELAEWQRALLIFSMPLLAQR